VTNLLVDSVCTECFELIYPGEIHFTCTKNEGLSSVYQCVICLEDERGGCHQKCKESAQVIREQVINLFRIN
jgi:hypothetical protein